MRTIRLPEYFATDVIEFQEAGDITELVFCRRAGGDRRPVVRLMLTPTAVAKLAAALAIGPRRSPIN